MEEVPIGNQTLSGFASGNTEKIRTLPLAKPRAVLQRNPAHAARDTTLVFENFPYFLLQHFHGKRF
jgi:hypothetical protein